MTEYKFTDEDFARRHKQRFAILSIFPATATLVSAIALQSNPYLKTYFADADWNRMGAKRNEGGDSTTMAAVLDAIARKIRHAGA